MGTYLSKPVLDKVVVTGEDLECEHTPLTYGCIDMQGWRKSMEDAHVTNPSIPLDNRRAKMFGVFDGHGGPEVARFCQRHIVDVMVMQPKWKEGDVAGALIDTFHAMDRLIDEPDRKSELYELRNNDAGTDIGCYDYKSAEESSSIVVANNREPMEISDSDEESDEADPELKQKATNETVHHTSTDPNDIVNKTVNEENVTSSDESVSTLDSLSSCSGVSDDSSLDSDDESEKESRKHIKNSVLAKQAEASKNEQLSQEEAINLFQKILLINTDELAGRTAQVDVGGLLFSKESNSITLTLSRAPADGAIAKDNVTTAAEGESTQIKQQSRPILLKSEASIEDNEGSEYGIDEEEDYANDIADDESGDRDEGESAPTASAGLSSPHDQAPQEEAFSASRIINGRQVCNLNDHPIQAGCTSIVAVLLEKTLTVANAGDSRAVLCRGGGIAYPLSLDHKPMQERELNRIMKAGGFVNQFGRVNGNLNLSRSIGDLKYKQTPGFPPSEQMITAEPDIISVQLKEDDEFFIIGCDGIWDCLTNEAAVKFVRDRIHFERCEEILQEMLDEIVSDDPRASQGIGGDNMTCMIVDLQPHKRSYYIPPGENGGSVGSNQNVEDDLHFSTENEFLDIP